MSEYHKIHSLFKRQGKTLVYGDWAQPAFGYLQGNRWTFTEKVDGTNIRVAWDGGAMRFGGRTDNASLPAPLVGRLQTRFLSQEERLRDIFSDAEACLYGEGYGPGIQKGGGLYRKD